MLDVESDVSSSQHSSKARENDLFESTWFLAYIYLSPATPLTAMTHGGNYPWTDFELTILGPRRDPEYCRLYRDFQQ
jgi:hypothetical protein